MAVGYQLVLWNRNKKIYDLALAGGVLAYLAAYIGVTVAITTPGAELSPLILGIRALGTCAFLMLTIILCIGPLARLNTAFLPLLYNRRHFGVATFTVALFHFVLTLIWYHSFGVLDPITSIFASSADYAAPLAAVPFQTLGFAAFVVLFVMAATSHDFWLANLSPGVWKALHMGVYAAYAALCLHIALGILQDETSSLYWWILGASTGLVALLHLSAGLSQRVRDGRARAADAPWISVGPVDAIPEKRARIIHVEDGDSIAVFRYDGKISAVSNVCAHQHGPLGEGRVIDGCITCPWHGYQYLPENGTSPPPYEEKIATYAVRIQDGMVEVDPRALPPGTSVPPAMISAPAA